MGRPETHPEDEPLLSEMWGNARRMRTWRVVLVLLPLFLLLALNTTDYWLPWVHSEESCTARESGISLPDEILFRHLLLSFGDAPNSRVSLVTFGEADGSDLLTDACSGRRFTAKMIDALNRQGVSVIALDKTYGDGSCLVEDANRALIAAVQNSNGKAHIVVGQGTESLKNTTGTDGCLVKQKNFDFGVNSLKRGITKLNTDDLKIPLRWPVYEDREQVHRKQPATDTDGNSFALVAAEAADPSVTSGSVLAVNLDRHSHPFGHFGKRIEPIPAARVLCSDNLGKVGEPCTNVQPVDLRGQVVVVASSSSTDVHPFLQEDASGAVLQAMYISALLSGRYYSELPFWGCAIGLAVWIFVVLLLRNLADTSSGKRKLLVRLTLFGFGISAVLLLVPQMFNTVPPFSFILAGLLSLAFEWSSEVLESGKRRVFESRTQEGKA